MTLPKPTLACASAPTPEPVPASSPRSSPASTPPPTPSATAQTAITPTVGGESL